MGARHEGKVAVVTGAASGLGQAVARRLAEDGADLVLVDLASMEETEGLVGAGGGQVTLHPCDVASEEDVARLREVVQERHGRCDVLVNCVGIYPFAPFEEITFAEWRRVFSTNLDSMFLTCKAFVPGMKERGFGRIVNITTNAYWAVVPLYTHYTASKGGVIGLTRALASEFGEHGITVNAVAPGLMRTPTTEGSGHAEYFEFAASQQAIKRVEVPADVVGTISFLASDDAEFVTGQTVVVDGGWMRV